MVQSRTVRKEPQSSIISTNDSLLSAAAAGTSTKLVSSVSVIGLYTTETTELGCVCRAQHRQRSRFDPSCAGKEDQDQGGKAVSWQERSIAIPRSWQDLDRPRQPRGRYRLHVLIDSAGHGSVYPHRISLALPVGRPCTDECTPTAAEIDSAFSSRHSRSLSVRESVSRRIGIG